MSPRRKLEVILKQLHSAREDPSAPASFDLLRQVLAHDVSHAVAKAADLIRDFECHAFTADLTAAFHRFMENPTRSDKACRAKIAVSAALCALGADAPEVYLLGIRHRQMEPVFGGSIDTAPTLRANSAAGLVGINHRQAPERLADLLADSEPATRAGAIQAMALSGDGVYSPLLRYKARIGDPEIPVLGECLTALLQIERDAALPFVSDFIDTSSRAIAEAALLALGESRCAGAFPILKDWWTANPGSVMQRTALVAIAMLRHDAAFGFLLGLITDADLATAIDAVEALALYKADPAMLDRVQRSAADRPRLSPAIAQAFRSTVR